MKYFSILVSMLLLSTVAIAEVQGMADLHVHLASHIPYGIALKGGTPADIPPTDMTTKHAFRQQMYLSWLKVSGVKLFVNAALVSIFSMSKEAAKAEILEQFEYSEKLLSQHPEFLLAKSPEEARQGITDGKIVFVHALEGADGLLENPSDGKFWADQGVATVGPIHLIDIPYGTSSILLGGKALLNWEGFFKKLFGVERKGLSKEGKKAIEILVANGIIVDTAHMSRDSIKDTLATVKDVPVIMSHGSFKSIRDDDRGLSSADVHAIYEKGGLVGLTLGQDLLHPLDELPEFHRVGTVDDLALHVNYFYKLEPGKALAIGSDFNGFVNHLEPIDHPGKLPQMWAQLIKHTGSLEPLNKSAEAFIQVWEKARASSIKTAPSQPQKN